MILLTVRMLFLITYKLAKTVTSEIPQCQMSHFLYLYYVDIQKLGMQAKQCLPNET